MHSSVQVGALAVLQEMTDVDSLQESVEGSEALLEALVECQVCSLLVTNLDRLDEAVREESEGVHNTLSIIENLVELRPEVVLQLCQAGFLHWLVRKLKVKVAYDDNKLYASELLSILLQVVYTGLHLTALRPSPSRQPGSSSARWRLWTACCSSSPTTSATTQHSRRRWADQARLIIKLIVLIQAELMENLFDCLCSLLLEAENRTRFLKGEGLQLMNLMLREKKKSRSGALKVKFEMMIYSRHKLHAVISMN